MECCGPGYASPAEAMQAPREKLLYTIAIYTGTGIQKPDYLATIDNDPDSPTYSQVISRCEVPGIGDELHHMGWNACSSCFDDASMARKYLLVPGVRSSNIHIIDCATDPRNPTLFKVIDGADIKAKTNLSAPHTIHCLGSEIIISMLGDAQGNAPGGYLHLNKDFEIVGRWENSMGDIKFGYDFWYQPRHNVMVNMHLTCTNQVKETCDFGLEGAKSAGICNIVALRGDPPKGQEKWEVTEGGFACALDLCKYMRQGYGDYFSIQVAGYPEGHPDRIKKVADLGREMSAKEKTRVVYVEGEEYVCSDEDMEIELNYLKEKCDAGGDVILTQVRESVFFPSAACTFSLLFLSPLPLPSCLPPALLRHSRLRALRRQLPREGHHRADPPRHYAVERVRRLPPHDGLLQDAHPAGDGQEARGAQGRRQEGGVHRVGRRLHGRPLPEARQVEARPRPPLLLPQPVGALVPDPPQAQVPQGADGGAERADGRHRDRRPDAQVGRRDVRCGH